jgi:hypothetical protein
VLLKNLDVNTGLANGTKGVVTGMDPRGWPVVKVFRACGTSSQPELMLQCLS